MKFKLFPLSNRVKLFYIFSIATLIVRGTENSDKNWTGFVIACAIYALTIFISEYFVPEGERV